MGIHDWPAWERDLRRVCSSCVVDSALETRLAAAHAAINCDFCSSQVSAPIGVLVDAILKGWRHEYEPAREATPWDEGEYVFFGPHWDTPELVADWSEIFRTDGLAEAVQDLLGDDNDPWVERDALCLPPDSALRDAWDKFRWIVMHQTRYVFWNTPEEDDGDDEPGYISPATLLDNVGHLADSLGLIRRIEPTEPIFRAQVEVAETHAWGAKRLGTAPVEHATKTNRMSPAGIPLFYGALDIDTAEAEVRAYARAEKALQVGEFLVTRRVHVLDLTDLPEIPSLFDPRLGAMRREVRFLHSFVADLQARVKEGSAEIEYVPTQVLTEYFLQVFRPTSIGGASLTGIVYPSDQADGAAVVLEFKNDQCFDDPVEAADSATAGVLLVSRHRLPGTASPSE